MPASNFPQKEPHAVYKWLFSELDSSYDVDSLAWVATSSLFDEMQKAHTAKKILDDATIHALKHQASSVIYSIYNEQTSETNPNSLIVLDEKNRLLQIRKWFEYEKAIAQNLAERVAQNLAISESTLPKIKDFLFQALPNRKEEHFPPLQKIAVIQALKKRFTVITGGPGTGKTYTVSALLIAALIDAQERNKSCKIALCAPTGKAAARMNESINKAFLSFEEKGLLKNVEIPQIKAQTIHSLIGYDSLYDKTYNNQNTFVDADLLIVDEASMIDLPLMYHLLKSVPQSCSMVLLGDPDQLSSVESGAILASICENGIENTFEAANLAWLEEHFEISHPKLAVFEPTDSKENKSPKNLQPSLFDNSEPSSSSLPLFRNQLIRLLDSHRFRGDTQMGLLVERIRNQAPTSVQWQLIESASDSSLKGITNAEELTKELIELLNKRLTQLKSITKFQFSGDETADDEVAKTIFELVGEMVLLSPTHHGELGVDKLNAWFELKLKQLVGLNKFKDEHYPGRLILITQNDRASGLFNGDVGVAVLDEKEELVYLFEDVEKGTKRCLPNILPKYKSAFVLTVHKSQGSEYKEVVLLLPAFNKKSKMAQNVRLVNKELLYTAITRAKEKVTIVGQKALWEQRANISTQRNSGLSYRLKEKWNRS